MEASGKPIVGVPDLCLPLRATLSRPKVKTTANCSLLRTGKSAANVYHKDN